MIRKAEDKDIDAIVQLLNEVLHRHQVIRPDLFGDAIKYDKNDLIEIIHNDQTPIYVSVDEQDVVNGYVFVRYEESQGRQLKDRKSLFIDDLCVDERVRGKAIGSSLMRYVYQLADEMDIDDVLLDVWSGNDEAVRFYQHMGMKPRKIVMEYDVKEQVSLVPFEDKDIDRIYEIFSNEEMNKFLPWYTVKNKEEALAFYKKMKDENKLFLGIVVDHKIIGYITVSPEYEIGYGLLPLYQGRGYMHKALGILMDSLRKEGIPYIIGTCDVRNDKSKQVMKSAGMKYQYSYQELWQPKNILVDFRMFQLNLNGNHPIIRKYWDESSNHYMENLE